MATLRQLLAELSKALEAGDLAGGETRNSSTDSGAPLKTESLEKNLKLITFKDSDIRFWKRMPKATAFNTVEEYNQLKSYGADRGGFNNEGELPEEEDSVYVRRAELVKFLGVTKSVSHPMQLVNTNVGNIVQREVTNGIQWILRKADKGLFWGNDKTTPQEWRGLYAQHASNDDFANFVKSFHDSKLIQPNTPQVTNGVMGQRVQKFQSQFGEIDLEYDIFAAKAGPRKVADIATSSKAPGAVTPGAAPAVAGTAGAGVVSRFAAEDAGDYIYAVAAKNRYGESTPTQLGAGAISVTAGQEVDLEFTDGGGAYAATGYVVYRSKVDQTVAGGLLYPIFEISTSELATGYDGAAAGHVNDINRWLPGTEQAMLMQGDSEVMEFKQLAPLMKMDLALLGPSQRFMCLLYGTPILYAPRKMVRFINVGTATA